MGNTTNTSYTDEQRNEQIAKMLGWFEQDFKGSTAKYVAYSEHNNYPHKGLPFDRDWNYLMDKAVAFIEKQVNGVLGGNGQNPVRLYMVRNEETNINVCGFMFNQSNKFTHSDEDKKRCLFLSVSDFAKEYNEFKNK